MKILCGIIFFVTSVTAMATEVVKCGDSVFARVDGKQRELHLYSYTVGSDLDKVLKDMGLDWELEPLRAMDQTRALPRIEFVFRSRDQDFCPAYDPDTLFVIPCKLAPVSSMAYIYDGRDGHLLKAFDLSKTVKQASLSVERQVDKFGSFDHNDGVLVHPFVYYTPRGYVAMGGVFRKGLRCR